MSDGTAVAYRYDGTYEGLMCCVFESFEKREMPQMLLSPRLDEPCLFPVREIETDMARSDRVTAGIAKRISVEALELAEGAMLCAQREVDLQLLRFLHLGFRAGPGVTDMLTEPPVDALFRALKQLWGEAHLLKGFIRFSDANGALVAVIEPKNRVLPLLRAHFTDRYRGEVFLIYDKTHQEALAHQGGKSRIFPMELCELPPVSDQERLMRALWQRFYQTIGIVERANPACRMSHMPKRYWEHMLEMDLDLGRAAELPDAQRKVLCYNQGIEGQ